MSKSIATLKSLRLYDNQLTPYLSTMQIAGSDKNYRQIKRQLRSSLQRILKNILRNTPEKSRINVKDVNLATKRGGGNGGWSGLNPGWCDQNPGQCQDSFSSCQGGANPLTNPGWCDSSHSQCTDSVSQQGGTILEPIAFQKIVRRAMNNLQDSSNPKTISADAYGLIQQHIESKLTQMV